MSCRKSRVASAAFLTRLAIFTRVKPNKVYFTGFVIVKLIAQDPFHWLSAPFPLFFYVHGEPINNYTTMDYCLQGA